MWGATPHDEPVVLLVEDDNDLRELSAELLRRRGFHVLTADNAVDAAMLCRLREQRIDVLVTDLQMPGVSGGELARSATALRPEMRVVYISGVPRDTAIRMNLIRPAAHYLSKPFTGETLASTIDNILYS